MSDKKMNTSRRHHLKSLILSIAAKWIDEEVKEITAAKVAYMSENCPKPSLSGDQAALMVRGNASSGHYSLYRYIKTLRYVREAAEPPQTEEACKKMHSLIDKMDEERYDLQGKVGKADKEIEDLRIKMVDVGGVKKPALKKVRMSADAMLKALLGSKHTVNMDLRAGLKQVKKEVKEEPAEAAGDWRKNIEDKADRKKMFETT